MTQRAIQYSLNVMMAQRRGNRDDFKDVFLLFTDGESKDFIAAVADRAKSSGFLVSVADTIPSTEN